jgi:hypothetical protein
LLDDELTEVEVDFAVDDEVELEAVELEAEELDVGAEELDVEAVPLAVCVEEDELPGMVCALTRPRSATPATALKAAPAVSRLSSLKAASRAWILPSVVRVLSIALSLGPGPQPNL